MTPEQMRALADEATETECSVRVRAVLRAAADQLEAVQVTLNKYAVTDEYNPGTEWTEPEDVWRLFRDLRAILTAGTAPQEKMKHD
ncbi:hypothetical protein DEJ21_14370 [Curtobacterium sp. MCSS17_006]|uniref:hypothetical protein n=1 Tax=Curtobacterium sp. MCSS17_006 TaxID=2175642 RepID=UPI000DAA1FB1|nr:hypothetical protein [Curtobacterium sp. MCSS17_006]PZE34031.1 hypothetical protein DEJ21_14370 [Curtobacterium sp. MCSS17_006]